MRVPVAPYLPVTRPARSSRSNPAASSPNHPLGRGRSDIVVFNGRAVTQLPSTTGPRATNNAVSKLASQIEVAFDRAVALQRRGHLDEARRLYQQVLQWQPQHFQALHLLGVVEAQTNRPERAAELIATAIEIDPHSAAAHNNYANALCRLNRYADAVLSYDRAIALQPDYAQAHHNRGIALLALKRHEAAIASFDELIALSPHDAQAYYHRGLALMKLEQHEAAVASFDKALALKADVGFFGWRAE